MPGTDFNAIENSIQLIIRTASGLSGDKVYWYGLGNNRPLAPFLVLQTPEDVRIGTVENTVTNNPVPAPGEEIILTSRTTAEINLDVQAFTKLKVSTAGEKAANAILRELRQALESETLAALFESTRLVLVSVGPVNALPRVLETQFEGRATLSLKLRISDEFTEKTTFIESAEVEGTYT